MSDLLFVWAGLVVTGLFTARVCWMAWERYHDPFHPVFLLAAPCFAMYFLQPAYLLWTDPNSMLRLLSVEQMLFIVMINGVGIAALLGAAVMRPKLPALSARAKAIAGKLDVKKLQRAAVILGSLGLGAFCLGVWTVGGLSEAYGRSYGGGYSRIGYLRDAYWLCLPAIAILFLIGKSKRSAYALIGLFSLPLLIHGILGARRGPTASLFICVVVAYGLSNIWRPRLWKFVGFMAALGALLLAIVANRGNLHLGMEEINLDRGLESYATKAGNSTEFVYGGATIISARESGSYFWGRRYATVIFVRPIPRFLWPSKYEFTAKFLGMRALDEAGANFGTAGALFYQHLGWKPPVGAAPGLIADLWIEFSYGTFLVLYAIGAAYRTAWRNAVSGNPFWMVGYSMMAAFSIYLIAQTLEAMLFRFLLTAGFTVFAWAFATGNLPQFGIGVRIATTQSRPR